MNLTDDIMIFFFYPVFSVDLLLPLGHTLPFCNLTAGLGAEIKIFVIFQSFEAVLCGQPRATAQIGDQKLRRAHT